MLQFYPIWNYLYNVTLVAITDTTILVPYFEVKSLQLIWRWGTRRFHPRVLHLQWSCRLANMAGYQDSIPRIGHQGDVACPIRSSSLLPYPSISMYLWQAARTLPSQHALLSTGSPVKEAALLSFIEWLLQRARRNKMIWTRCRGSCHFIHLT